jgi:hypothetical protein
MPHPYHSPWFVHSNYIWRKVKVMKLLIIQIFPASYYYSLLGSKYLPRRPLCLPVKFIVSWFLLLISLNYITDRWWQTLYVWIFRLEASVACRVGGSTPGLYSRGLGFKSRPRGFFVLFKSSARLSTWTVQRISTGRFLRHLFNSLFAHYTPFDTNYLS